MLRAIFLAYFIEITRKIIKLEINCLKKLKLNVGNEDIYVVFKINDLNFRSDSMKKKVKRKIRIGRLVTLYLFIFMVCFGAMIFIKSDFFSVNNIKIINNKNLNKSYIKDLSEIVLGKNIFTYDIKQIELNIKKSPYISKVSVKRSFPKSLEIKIEEKDIFCVLNNGDDYCYVDNNLEYIDKIKEENIKKEDLIVKIKFSIKNEKIYYERKKDKEDLILLINNMKNQNLDKKMHQINFCKENYIYMKTKGQIETVILRNKNTEKNAEKLAKVLLDLESQNIHYGKVDMTFDKYILYTY